MRRGQRCAPMQMIPFSTERSSPGSPLIPQFLMLTGSPRMFLISKPLSKAIFFFLHRSIHLSKRSLRNLEVKTPMYDWYPAASIMFPIRLYSSASRSFTDYTQRVLSLASPPVSLSALTNLISIISFFFVRSSRMS